MEVFSAIFPVIHFPKLALPCGLDGLYSGESAEEFEPAPSGSGQPCYFPTRRAMTAEPMAALRED
jgi:hypothetical protein